MNHELLSPVAQRLGWTLIHSLWQFAFVALLLLAALRLLGERSPQARYLAGCAALVAMFLMAALTFGMVEPLAGPSRPAPAGHIPHVEWRGVQPRAERNAPRPETDEVLRAVDDGTIAEPAIVPTRLERRSDRGLESGSISSPVNRPLPDRVGEICAAWKHKITRGVAHWLNALIAVWVAGVALMSTRPLVGWHCARRLRRHGLKEVARGVSEAACRIARRLGISRAVAVMQSSLVDVPTVIGTLRPLILLPASTLTGLPRDQLEAVIAHELGHIRRNDYIVNVIQVVLETIFFYHPTIWWVSHRMRLDREDCCDEIALAITSDRAGYAKMLLWLDERRSVATQPALSLRGGSLRARVRRILHPKPRRQRPGSGGAATIGLLSMAVLVSSLWLSAMAGNGDQEDESTANQPMDGVLVPEGINEILGRLEPDMEEQRLLRLLRKSYPDAEEFAMSWSGTSGVATYRLSPRYTLTVPQYTKPPDHDTRRIHPKMSVSVRDWNEKRSLGVSFNDWSQSEAGKDAETVSDAADDVQKLLPGKINRILGQIRPEMPEETLEEILQNEFPKVEIKFGGWSGRTGYSKFRVSPRFELRVSEYSIPNHLDRRFVKRDLTMTIRDRNRKQSVQFQVRAIEDGEDDGEEEDGVGGEADDLERNLVGLSAKGRAQFLRTKPIEAAKLALWQQGFDTTGYEMDNATANSYCPPQPTQYDWLVSFPNRKADCDPLWVAVTKARRAWRLDPRTLERVGNDMTVLLESDGFRAYTGRVVDEAGAPIAGATVRVGDLLPFRAVANLPTDHRDSFGQLRDTVVSPADVHVVTTDQAGRFTFEQLRVDCLYAISVYAKSHVNRRIRIITGNQDDYPSERGYLSPGEDIVLRQTVVVPIQVRYADTEEPAAEVRVLINHSSGTGGDQQVTDEEGMCLLQIPPGESRLYLTPGRDSAYAKTEYLEATVSPDSNHESDPLIFELKRAAASDDDRTRGGSASGSVDSGHGVEATDSNARHAAATLAGRMIFDGPRPEPRLIDIDERRSQREAAAGVPAEPIRQIADTSLVIGKDNGLANVFVYLVATDESPRWTGGEPAPTATMTMTDDGMEPRAVALAPKEKLVIRNRHEDSTNVRIEGSNNQFNVVLAPGASSEFSLDIERMLLPMPVHSDIHPWTKTYLLAHENNLFAVTDSAGRFRIDEIPPGQWEIRFWHERTGYLENNFAWNGRKNMHISERGLALNEIKAAASQFE